MTKSSNLEKTGKLLFSDNEGVSSQLSEDHAEKEEIDAEEANEMNSESSENTFIQMNQQNLKTLIPPRLKPLSMKILTMKIQIQM